jgi:hypothetical protein
MSYDLISRCVNMPSDPCAEQLIVFPRVLQMVDGIPPCSVLANIVAFMARIRLREHPATRFHTQSQGCRESRPSTRSSGTLKNSSDGSNPVIEPKVSRDAEGDSTLPVRTSQMRMGGREGMGTRRSEESYRSRSQFLRRRVKTAARSASQRKSGSPTMANPLKP